MKKLFFLGLCLSIGGVFAASSKVSNVETIHFSYSVEKNDLELKDSAPAILTKNLMRKSVFAEVNLDDLHARYKKLHKEKNISRGDVIRSTDLLKNQSYKYNSKKCRNSSLTIGHNIIFYTTIPRKSDLKTATEKCFNELLDSMFKNVTEVKLVESIISIKR